MKLIISSPFDFVINGDPDAIRTHGLLLRREPLYPSELQSHPIDYIILFKKKKHSFYLFLIV